jgi:hypothetical protein
MRLGLSFKNVSHDLDFRFNNTILIVMTQPQQPGHQ